MHLILFQLCYLNPLYFKHICINSVSCFCSAFQLPVSPCPLTDMHFCMHSKASVGFLLTWEEMPGKYLLTDSVKTQQLIISFTGMDRHEPKNEHVK